MNNTETQNAADLYEQDTLLANSVIRMSRLRGLLQTGKITPVQLGELVQMSFGVTLDKVLSHCEIDYIEQPAPEPDPAPECAPEWVKVVEQGPSSLFGLRDWLDGRVDNSGLLGKYIVQFGWSDVNLVGRVVGTFGRYGLKVEPWTGSYDLSDCTFESGGFSGHCSNPGAQKWTFARVEGGELFKMRLSAKFFKTGFRVYNKPTAYYDVNF